jgi:hypothetical protein
VGITADFIRMAVAREAYEISLHADDERIADGLIIRELEDALSRCEIIEQYPDDPRGESCLALGFTAAKRPVHTVCGINRSGCLILITVYIPSMPKWKDSRTRNR